MSLPQTSQPDPRTRTGAIGLALAGILFVLYEFVAPREDQTTLEGAESWASAAWSFAHIAAIIGLILIPLTYGALRGHFEGTRNEKTAFLAATTGYIGSALTISYYGAEVYGLKAIGARAVADGDASLTEVGEAFRMDSVAATIFAIGLALIALAAILIAVAVWRSGTVNRWSAIPLAAAMVLYLPHFYFPYAGRLAWGVLVGLSALILAWAMFSARRPINAEAAPQLQKA
ncbi:hypothetical protein [Glycomyces buryatensis]|uniref:DUF4386 family protein n=1 Tax=Glycomyces buryatensis TaxID=2570927 RepID=A0A4S8QCB9_9ACTN|nr:hypothetical protein [Glycomyces buryatensis]THV42008.1 hypothetical protein FAB82_08765 [Glycomyces buryatensis]